MPPFLKEGDRIALVSPAYWVPQEVLGQAAEAIRGWGLQPVIGPHTNNLNVNVYAGTAEERSADILWALEDDSIKACLCSRGGYGSIHLLNRIPKGSCLQHPKWLIGHGDISVLLNAVTNAGLMCIHGPMSYQIANGQEPSTTILRNMLFGELPQYRIPANSHNKFGHAEGILIGGNLSSYAAIVGTQFQLPLNQDVILFIEEVEEPLHNIDRMFYRLLLQLDFERVKGVIFGTFNSIRFDLQFGSVEQMLIAHLHNHDIPVCCGFPVGSDSCIPLMVGAPCSLDVTSSEALLSFNIDGEQQLYELSGESHPLFK